ncbi:helix-turn-helix transcriptional regulator [Phenylobacterium montanum]|uniref:PAS domain-containing protein n=1 Tax=Phenylobacterium montanum TaxID=2823693 RepID=A0A975G251_9CAUL|nr:PAS domain-containing protein [Caulobacter sp. S6]QUD89735.1 PAS domain-containing protein [Caulobacter sp. S6]
MSANQQLLARWTPFADGIAALLHPHVEVVVHDLSTQTVVHIANNLSKRSLGDESALDEIEFDPDEQVIGPYGKVNWDGSMMRSVSIVARDDAGAPIGLVCVNLDISVFERAKAALSLFLGEAPLPQQPEKLFRDDWQERINIFLNTWLAERGQTLAALDRREKKALVEALFAEGAFRGRSAAPYVAEVLGLSRATVFNHLKALRG